MSLLKDKIEVGAMEAELKVEKTLNQFPPLIKWAVIALVLGTLPGYIISKKLSHKYWMSQYKAALLSAKPSFESARRPRIASVDITKTGESTYSAVATVINENLDLSLENVPYEFKFLNQKGEVVYTASGKTFFLPGKLTPGQKKFIVVPRLESKENIVSSSLEFPPELNWQKRLKLPTVNLTTPLPQVYQQFDPLAFVLEGSFQNNSAYALKEVRLTFMVYNKQGQVIATSQRVENTLAPFERRSYKQLWPNVYSADAYSSVTYAETDILDNENLKTVTPSSGSSSDLNRPDTDSGF